MTVDGFVKTKVLPEYRDIVSMLRELMHEMAPDAKEAISYGIPVYKRKRILALISPTKKGITFAFSRGAEFEDKYGLLKGVGQVSKHVKIKKYENCKQRSSSILYKTSLKTRFKISFCVVLRFLL
jgi:hypothetical protein